MNKNNQPLNDKEITIAINLVKSNLSSDLLSGKYTEKPIDSHYTWGLCSVASEALYFILGGNKRGLTAYFAKDIDNTTHWWLQDNKGNILDPTKEQYTSVNKLPPYERGIKGTPGGFMGIRKDIGNIYGFDRKPSKRAEKLLNKILEDNTIKQMKNKMF